MKDFIPNIAIVIPCYNRVDTLEVLLESLNKALYRQKVDLVFSIDYSGNSEIFSVAKKFNWKYGKKIIKQHEENIGLRKNILFCGDMTTSYDAVIVLEDDLIVSQYFFDYAIEACMFYWDDENVAEISLYSYKVSESLNVFYPMTNGYDTYFMQWTSSWGQLWTRPQWEAFIGWYSKHDGDLSEALIPVHVKEWKKSWKKYHIAYLVDTNKYCVYPAISFSTTRPTIGTHSDIVKFYNPLFVQLFETKQRDYIFQRSYDSLKYDCFFQIKDLEIKYEGKIITVDFDLFCDKKRCNFNHSYYITSKKNSKGSVLKSWGRYLLPFEKNVIEDIEGEGLYLFKIEDYETMKLTPTEKEDRKMFLSSSEHLMLLLNKLLKKVFHL